MLLFVWLALSPCLRKWGKAESFVGSWRCRGSWWTSSPRDTVSQRIISCSWLLPSVLVWSPLFQRRRSGSEALFLDVLRLLFFFFLPCVVIFHDFIHAERIPLLFVFYDFVCAFWLDNGTVVESRQVSVVLV